MPRPCFRRKIWGIPPSFYFRPEGDFPPGEEEVVLTLDELEAIRLADLENLYQEEAAQMMGVSRPTFGRIIDSAHKKIAQALVKGKPLKIEGGPVEILEPESPHFPVGFRCRRREGPKMQKMMGFEGQSRGAGGFCVCPKCGYRKPHQAGVRCMDERCPQCGSVMVREGSYHHRIIEERKKGGE
ncbi:MAG: DUF134 domain-containing protein [Caldiserica bacterium]|jgi:predicted DNA-binding protein (UPF0251 family)|nr:DUF134 domain-containing protein [Caldisericota bacterium]MDH7562304.1 DUF134 domain-containing protein [Caldisericota bacterium]